ncbi:MAG: hypothetical protein WBC04_13875 [Candidatus Acidiferrales bacterium]|jgi:hypothetical protein
MRRLQVWGPRAFVVIASVAFALLSSAMAARAKDLPSDVCSLLPGSELEKVLGQSFGSPSKNSYPPPFPNNPSGTRCEFQSKTGLTRSVIFIIYADPSEAVAKDTANKLKPFFGPPTDVAGIGDSAYLDSNHAIHVQKGKVRYFISIVPIGTYTPQKEKQLKDLAIWVAAQL